MVQNDIRSTSLGLLRCLQVLTEEAVCLGLTQTAAALGRAIETCRAESTRNAAQVQPQTEPALLH